ncbi:HalOD1 output domain-containing protein [Natrarchaeobius halalkaliphilus]|nr:HalOD1 output domain-containing protein [Natrarchaeobius halalkaliphilus]
MSVIEALASAEETDPTALEPTLYESIDPDALDALVQSATRSMTLEFTHGDYLVRIDESASVTVTPTDDRLAETV